MRRGYLGFNTPSDRIALFPIKPKVHHRGEKGDQAVIALIDSGIDILHEAFLNRNGTQSRILGVWVQREVRVETSDLDDDNPVNRLAYGRFYNNEEINNFIAEYKTDGILPPASLRDENGHGTHVASIAAGRPFGDFGGGVAPDARILVIVPKYDFEEGSPESLGYNNNHLDAIAFIRDFVDWMRLPVVINISQGMNAGAHDGTSLLEAGFDKLTSMGREPGIAIVKSAGNQGESDSHAKLTIPPSQRETLTWETQDSRKVTIELWFSANMILSFRLKSPNGDSISMGFDLEHTQHLPTGDYVKFDYDRIVSENGDSRVTITLIQLINQNDVYLQNGVWELEILNFSSINDHPLDKYIHAWIERQPNTARFVGDFVDRDLTITIPATSQSVLVVGAMQPLLDSSNQVANFSGRGPTRSGMSKPELIAPGDQISAAETGFESGSRTGLIAMRGTSMAAPHVSGAIALLFSRRQKRKQTENVKQITANQIRKVLQYTAQDYDGTWDGGKGYGVLDIDRLINKFDS